MSRRNARTLLLGAIAMLSATLAACASDQRPSLQPTPSTSPTTTGPSPDEVKAGIRAGLASVRSFRAEIVIKHHGTERRKTLEKTSGGTVRQTDFDLDRERTSVYDPVRGVSYDGFPGSSTSGLPPGRRDPVGPDPWTSELRPGVIDDPVLFARHVLDWPQFTVATTTAHERPAWGIQWSPPRGSNPDHVLVTLDRQSGLGVRAEAFFENQAVYVFEVTALELNADVSIIAPPAATGGRGFDLGYRRTTLEEASHLAGYPPVVPAWLPAGFVPAEVGYAEQDRRSLRPDSTHIVSAAYRRGLDELVVATRLRGSRPWTNPFLPAPSSEAPASFELPGPTIRPFEWEPASVSGGAFGGARAERTTRAWYGQSLFWAMNDQLSLTVQGDVTGDEMRRIVESLKLL